MDDLLSSRQAAELLGVGISTIKRWSDDGVLACVKTEGGHRRFRRDDVDRLLRRQQGRLKEEEASIARWIDLLVSKTPQIALIAELMKEKANHGTWARTSNFLGRVIEGLGRRWEHGTLSITEEHIASERLDRALAWASQSIVVSESAPTCLLLTAHNDEHTLALSLAEISAREAGWNATWLGRGTPFADMDAFLGYLQPRVVGVSASQSSPDESALARQHETLVSLADKHGFTLVLGGSGAWPKDPKGAERLRRFDRWAQLLTKLADLGEPEEER